MKPEPTLNVTVSQSQISAILGLIYNYIHTPDFAQLNTYEQELIMSLDDLFADAENAIFP